MWSDDRETLSGWNGNVDFVTLASDKAPDVVLSLHYKVVGLGFTEQVCFQRGIRFWR